MHWAGRKRKCTRVHIPALRSWGIVPGVAGGAALFGVRVAGESSRLLNRQSKQDLWLRESSSSAFAVAALRRAMNAHWQTYYACFDVGRSWLSNVLALA